MLNLIGAEGVSEGKIFTKKILKLSDLKADDQVIVKRSGTNEVVAQFFCDNGNCSDDLTKEGRFNQTEDLVLILRNCSKLDQFEALLNLIPVLRNFTLDEVLLSSATPALTDEALNPRINHTEPHPINKLVEVLSGVSAIIVIAGIPAVAHIIKITVITVAIIIVIIIISISIIFWKFCKPVPKKQQGNDVEMDTFIETSNGPQN